MPLTGKRLARLLAWALAFALMALHPMAGASTPDAASASANACPVSLSSGLYGQKRVLIYRGRPFTVKVTIANKRDYNLRGVNLRITMPKELVITKTKTSPRLKPAVGPIDVPELVDQAVNYYWLNMALPSLKSRTFRLRTWVSDCPSAQGRASVGALAYLTVPANGTVICTSNAMGREVRHAVNMDVTCVVLGSAPFYCLPFDPFSTQPIFISEKYVIARGRKSLKAADRPVFDCITPAPTPATYIWFVPYGEDQVCQDVTGPVPVPDIARRRALEEGAGRQGAQRELGTLDPTPDDCYYGKLAGTCLLWRGGIK
jgi:hypothetical protein